MSFLKETLENVQCDNCKTTYQDESTGYAFWLDKNDAWECANEDGWTENSEKHYCPKCHDYNDEDELIINTERTKIDNSVFPKHLLDKITTEPFDYFLGVDTYDKKAMALCLSRKTEKGVEILLSKVSQDEVSFENEVKLLSELFNANVLRTES